MMIETDFYQLWGLGGGGGWGRGGGHSTDTGRRPISVETCFWPILLGTF